MFIERDVTHDRFQHVIKSHKTFHAAVFVQDQGMVDASLPKLLECLDCLHVAREEKRFADVVFKPKLGIVDVDPDKILGIDITR